MSTYAITQEIWAKTKPEDRVKLLDGLKDAPEVEGTPALVHDWDAWPSTELAKHDWAALPPQLHPPLIAKVPIQPPAETAPPEAHAESTGRKKRGE